MFRHDILPTFYDEDVAAWINSQENDFSENLMNFSLRNVSEHFSCSTDRMQNRQLCLNTQDPRLIPNIIHWNFNFWSSWNRCVASSVQPLWNPNCFGLELNYRLQKLITILSFIYNLTRGVAGKSYFWRASGCNYIVTFISYYWFVTDEDSFILMSGKILSNISCNMLEFDSKWNITAQILFYFLLLSLWHTCPSRKLKDYDSLNAFVEQCGNIDRE